jgi:hypothetical protein
MTNSFVSASVANSPATNPQTGLDHLVRSAGSYVPGECLTDGSARKFLSTRNWVEILKDDLEDGVYNPSGICRYWQAELPMDAVQGVALLKDVPADKVAWRQGSHQMELVADVQTKPTRTVSLITGPGEDGPIVWTWFPGEFTPFIRVEPGTPIEQIPGNATVKLAW